MKDDLRKWAKSVRASLDMETISIKLVEKLSHLEEYNRAKNVMLFYPKPGEVNLLAVLKDKSKHFYLPKIVGTGLLCCPYSENMALCTSCFGTKEPVSGACNPALLDLIIVPALACDINNYRLGYGKGFYDRFLTGLNTVKISCIPERLIIDTIAPDEFDIKMDKIITA